MAEGFCEFPQDISGSTGILCSGKAGVSSSALFISAQPI
jgi:hypothetical protein